MNNLFNNRRTVVTTVNSINDDAFRDVRNGDLNNLKLYITPQNVNNVIDRRGNNLMQQALLFEDVNIVKFLLGLNINLHHLNSDRKSSWDMALRTQNITIIRVFTDHENAFKEQNNRLIIANDNLRDQVDKYKTENTDLNTQVVILKNNNKRLRDDNDVLRVENDTLKTDNKKLKATVDNLTNAFRK